MRKMSTELSEYRTESTAIKNQVGTTVWTLGQCAGASLVRVQRVRDCPWSLFAKSQVCINLFLEFCLTCVSVWAALLLLLSGAGDERVVSPV